MKELLIKNTYNIKLSGRPNTFLDESLVAKSVAVCPSSLPFSKIKKLVNIGDKVKIGTPLFIDKRHPDMQFVSPGSGEVSDIKYGHKRCIDEIVISLDKDEESIEITPLRTVDIKVNNKDQIKQALLNSGLWSLLREYPFQRIPSSQARPSSIYVSCDMDEVFMPKSSVLYQRYFDEFKAGLRVLEMLTDGSVYVGVSGTSTAKEKLSQIATHEIIGKYPANHPGVFLYYNKTSSKENNSWGIYGYDVIRIGQLLKTGHYPKERIISVGGSRVKNPQHVLIREGMDVDSIISKQIKKAEAVRIIAGGVLTGRHINESSHLWQEDRAITVIGEGKDAELLSFFRPGFNKPTFGNTYMSALLPDQNTYDMPSTLNGGIRSCIACLECPKVCPVEIQPQFLMKSLYAGDIEEAIQLGLLDCVECGLCTYVCPSKIELNSIFNDAKVKLEKETQ